MTDDTRSRGAAAPAAAANATLGNGTSANAASGTAGPPPPGAALSPASGRRSVSVRDQAGLVAVMQCLDFETIADEGFQRAYPREIVALKALREPAVAAPRSYIVDAAGWIVASIRGHIDGAPLADVLAGQPRGLDVQTAATVAKDVLTALVALHHGGIAHRRVGVDQVIVRSDGDCVLVDSGLASRAGSLGWDGDVTAELAAVAELFATCLRRRRLVSRGRGHRARSAARPAGGTPEQLATLLTGSDLAHLPAAARAVGVLAALESAAAEHFEAGWEEHGRDRLAAAAKRSRPRRGPTSGLPDRGRDRRRAARRDRLARGAQGKRERDWSSMRAQAIRAVPARLVAARAEPGAGRHAVNCSGRVHAPGRRVVRYAVPLAAFTITFTLVLAVASHATSDAGGLQANQAPATGASNQTLSNQNQANQNQSNQNQAPRDWTAVTAISAGQPSAGARPHFAVASDTRTRHADSYASTAGSRRSSDTQTRTR